ncbi:MAG: methionine--tRNA ligase [Patescibacteria group bacterium]|nr:methionine--tRNA ligase [Patescibacteria group bacterium]
MKRKYFTTTLPYINARPHIAHAREFVMADAYKRLYSFFGYETLLNVGTDEHGLKIFRKAQKEKKGIKQYCDEQVRHFKKLCEKLDIEYDLFTRTTDDLHVEAAQKFWKTCDKNGFIYKKKYKIKYCVGCELEKTDSDLINGKCPDHPNQKIEIIEEENYFFKFSVLQKKLLRLYKQDPDFIKPAKRYNEIVAFVNRGLEDFSISRLKEKMPCGIEVPGDPEHIMYVWFDALINYVSAIGWPHDMDMFKKWWPVTQFCGKDNLRQQTAMWQAMLMAADLPPSEKVLVNGFITVDNQKMSKSLGNVIDPLKMSARYGSDATRYLLLSFGVFGEDTDITWKKLDERYNADLANGIGNLTNRIVTLYKKVDYTFDFNKGKREVFINNKDLKSAAEEGHLEIELSDIMKQSRYLDKTIEEEKPWELLRSDKSAFRESIEGLSRGVFYIALRLKPFMPNISSAICESLVKKDKVHLFPRL